MPGGVIPASEREIALLANDLKAQFNAVLVKLDADTGVTDTNYASTLTVTVADLAVPTTD